MAFRGVIPDFQLGNPLYSGALVTFYEVGPDGEKTETVARLYAEPVGNVTAANPQTLDADGKLSAPVYILDPVIAEIVGPNIGSHNTGPIAPRGTWKGRWVSGARYYASDFVTDPTHPYNVYIVHDDHVAGASFATDAAAGRLQLVVKGGDLAYVTIDDPGRPSSGETWRTLIADEALIQAGMPGSYATVLTPSTDQAVFSLRRNGSQFGMLVFDDGETTGWFAAASDVVFDPGDELSIRAPNPRNDTLSGLAATIRLIRIPI